MKKIIFAFILGGIVFSSIAVIAVTQINANEITYTKDGADTTVEAALNDLYTTANKPILNRLVISLQAAETGTGNSTTAFHSLSALKDYYKYFKITSVTPNEYTSFCSLRGAPAPSYVSADILADTEYETSNYTRGIWVNVGSNDSASTTNYARCSFNVELYNK